jgi:hypothetical protein
VRRVEEAFSSCGRRREVESAGGRRCVVRCRSGRLTGGLQAWWRSLPPPAATGPGSVFEHFDAVAQGGAAPSRQLLAAIALASSAAAGIASCCAKNFLAVRGLAQVGLQLLDALAQLFDGRVGRCGVGLGIENLAVGAGRDNKPAAVRRVKVVSAAIGTCPDMSVSGRSNRACRSESLDGGDSCVSWPKSYPPPAPEIRRSGRRTALLR